MTYIEKICTSFSQTFLPVYLQIHKIFSTRGPHTTRPMKNKLQFLIITGVSSNERKKVAKTRKSSKVATHRVDCDATNKNHPRNFSPGGPSLPVAISVGRPRTPSLDRLVRADCDVTAMLTGARRLESAKSDFSSSSVRLTWSCYSLLIGLAVCAVWSLALRAELDSGNLLKCLALNCGIFKIFAVSLLKKESTFFHCFVTFVKQWTGSLWFEFVC